LEGDHPTDDARGRRLALGLFAAIFVLMGVDLGMDLVAGGTPQHVALEGGVMLLALTGAGMVVRDLLRVRARAQSLARDLTRARADADAHAEEAARWRAEAETHIRGLRGVIDEQFARWQLTPAECEVALLLLKGLSSKEIAAVRDTSERTARQQATAIYRKADLSGRAELAAWFLEDLLAPGSSVSPT
jgi:DNA-binding CsgD family transcriptional regulator